MIVGLGHRARRGKDTVAGMLREYGFTSTSFARQLKNAAQVIFGFCEEQLNGDLKEVIDPFWGETPRVILQRFGTDCMRNGFSDDIWIRVLKRRIDGWLPAITDVVITDVRFRNEAEAVQSWGGVVRRIDRDLGDNVPQHASETELLTWDGWNCTIDNNGTLDELKEKVKAALSEAKNDKA